MSGKDLRGVRWAAAAFLALTAAAGAQSTTWTGAVSADWLVAGNWSSGLPSVARDAIIPAAPSVQPVVAAPGATCRALTLAGGATLTLNATCDVAGGATLDGAF